MMMNMTDLLSMC